MSTIKNVVLSVGTNLGDRLKNLLEVKNLLQNQLGGTQQWSGIYETPAWGFQGEPFYNAAILVKTSLDAFEILHSIRTIENQMGRQRNPSEGYASRIIDIDIILYENQIINTPELEVPHPRFTQRKFVLLPMQDLSWQWIHPQTQQNLQQILKECTDTSDCKKITLNI